MVNVIEFTVDPRNAEAYLGEKAERIVAGLRAQLTKEMLGLRDYIRDDKLRGQVLHQRSGNLIGSFFTEQTETAETMLGTVNVGKNAPYAKWQEYGAKIPEVSGKLMVFQRAGDTIFTRRHKAFTLPPRPFMAPSIEERKPEILAGLQGAVDRAVNA